MASGRTGLSARIGAKLRGDVPADEVLALLSAGGTAYEDYLAADRLREELTGAGIDPWTASPAESSQLLCAWNAYALQSVAQAFVEAAGLTVGTGGFLPKVTAEQALRILREVPSWSARARRAAADPGFDIAREVALPAPLPPWVVVEPCPRSHLQAMRSAGVSMLERIEASLADLDRLPSARGNPDKTRLHGHAEDVRARLSYAEDMLAAGSGMVVHEGAEAALRDAVATSFYLGQLVSRPRLARVGPPPRPFVDASPPSGPLTGYGPPARPYGHEDDHGHHGHH